MPDIRDISIGSRYTGDPNLGGGSFGVAQIDTRPLQQLAMYTFEYNRAAFLQRQKDFEEKAKELADLTSYDLTTAIPEDRKKIQKGYDELYTYVQQNPNVLDYKNNPKGWMEYNKKKNDFENKLRGGKVRSVLYSARQKEVSETTNAGLKSIYQKNLDDEANSTDLDTPLKHTQQWEIAPVVIKPPDSQKFDVTSIGATFLGTRTWELPDMESVDAQASRIELGLDMSDLDTDEFRKKPQKERDLIMAERNVQVASGRLEPIKSAEAINAILQNEKYNQPEFRNSDGTLNIEAVKADNSGNGLVTGFLSTMQQYNAKMDEMTKAIDSRYFQDKLGKELSFGAGALNRDRYRKIDLKDGVSVSEILKPRILGLAKPETFTTEIKERALTRENLALDWFKARSERLRANKEGADKASIVIDKPAILFGEHIDTTKKFFSSNPQAQNFTVKYAAVDPYTRAATGLQEGHFLTYKKDGSYVTSSDYDVTKDKTIGTIENFAQGMINAVKTIDKVAGSDKDGTMAEGFQIKSEAKFKELWGTSSGKYIWDNWGEPATKQEQGGSEGAIELSGKVDANTLKTGQSYIVDGKTYIWNGTRLKPQ